MSNKLPRSKNQEVGFSLLETIVAIAILTIGLISTVAAVTYALQMSMASKNIGSAKLIIVTTFEQIEALRNSHRLRFNQIANVGDVDNSDSNFKFSGFSVGLKPMSLSSGPDQIDGTDDDLSDAGADGVYGTGDDFQNEALIRSGYQREIIISTLPNQRFVKRVEVKVHYVSVNGIVRTISGVCYFNDNDRTVIY